ncbi:hypothetical protein EJ05DRAFT_171596 [Pseudovirgaria hyperparasitica]|uniref:Uncharacterized protein n=1 Tax=Pseudovirgaria hyperparasitica TaxID=470096 RepID=A0A6A6VX09_9PEZI|nr:uncharacterized protein EJ05DRAFT_171596 [Pseudovirgaria hyperparasitica]KAF2753781.1 hypothetical protein EJ05DRAFT_171596 [Pseudovirgaria hyperparasitica]
MAPIPQSPDASAPLISLRALTTTLTSLLPHSALQARQVGVSVSNSGNGIIPSSYHDMNSGPAPGVVIGATLGSVAGFLLLCWLFMSLAGFSGGAIVGGEEEIIVRKQPSHATPRSRRSRRSRSTREVRSVREVSVGRSPRRSERIIIDDTRRGVPLGRPRSRSILVEERVEHRVPGDDMVEVIEEVSDITASSAPPPPRRKSSSRRDGGSGGYRY